MKINHIITLLLSTALWCGCSKEDIETYSGGESIFFAQQYGTAHFENNISPTGGSKNAHQAYSKIGFGGMIETDSLLSINVQLMGYVRDYDRPFGVEVVTDSTTALNGVEFELVDPKTDAVIRAGASSTAIRVLFHKTERMDDENLMLQLRLIPGEHFVLPFDDKGYGKMPIIHSTATQLNEFNHLNLDPAIHNIFINNFLTVPPGWNDKYMGLWSERKFRLLLDYSAERLGWTIATWNDNSNMWPPATRYELARTLLAQHLLEQYNKGREYWEIDPDGTMMWCPSTILPWGEDSRPEYME